LFLGGQFASATGGQFAPARGGHFKLKSGGQFHRFFHFNQHSTHETVHLQTLQNKCQTKVGIRPVYLHTTKFNR